MKSGRNSEQLLTVRTRTVGRDIRTVSGAGCAGLSQNARDLGWRLSCKRNRVKQPLISNQPVHAAEDRFRVLVADDQDAITHALELLLRSAGMEVLMATHLPK